VDLSMVPHGEARALGQTLNEMAAQLEKQVSDQKALLAMVSHELRTPLARMRLLTESARGSEPSKREQALTSLDAEIIVIDELVAHLLASTRIDFGGLSRVSIDPSEVAVRALELCKQDPLVLDVSESAQHFSGDPTLVLRALVNLLENAQKHGVRVSLFSVFSKNGRTHFQIDDDGPGIPEGDLARIFLPFAKGQSNSPRSFGLGLSLVKRIAEAHGGDAYAQSRAEDRAKEGGGARLTIAFPC
jgi:two-component system, OmpR family, sensor kinase